MNLGVKSELLVTLICAPAIILFMASDREAFRLRIATISEQVSNAGAGAGDEAVCALAWLTPSVRSMPNSLVLTIFLSGGLDI
jgi:hypothetical protein